jgi:hypothetical protein
MRFRVKIDSTRIKSPKGLKPGGFLAFANGLFCNQPGGQDADDQVDISRPGPFFAL